MKQKKWNLFVPLFLSLVFSIVACKDEANPRTLAENKSNVEEESVEKGIFKAKVRKTVGENELQRSANGDWKKLRFGQNVVENNRIRTAIESDAVLAVADGSTLWITENSDVTLQAELIDSLNKKISIVIKNGQVHFDVQKQSVHQAMEFRTETAVAAIRGTAGFVGEVGGKMVASLKEGKVEVSDKTGLKEVIVENQTIIVDKEKGVSKMDLAASGTNALSKAIDSLTKLTSEATVAQELESVLKKYDEGYKARRADFEKNLRFLSAKLPDTTFVPSVTLQARVTPGVIVSVLGESDTVGENGLYQREFSWELDAYGQKRFLASCSNGDVDVPCFMWTTIYAEPSSMGAAPAVEEPAPEEKVEEAAPATNLNLSVKFAGARNEKVHLDLPATEYSANMKVNLAGISAKDLSQVKSIQLKRGGKVVESVPANEITSLNYEFTAKIPRNRIANFEVAVTLKNGKVYKAKKTFEVYCLVSNHPGGKARNSILPQDQEYDRIKQSGDLKAE